MYDIVDEMHCEEKKREFKRRFGERFTWREKTFIFHKVQRYSVLKFIGVGGIEDKPDAKLKWNLKHSDRPDKYVIIKDKNEKVIP